MSSSGDYYGGFNRSEGVEPIYEENYIRYRISRGIKEYPDIYLEMFNFSDIERYVRKKKLEKIDGQNTT